MNNSVIIEIEELFNSIKKKFDCEELILKTYRDAFSNVTYAFSKNTKDYISYESRRWAVAKNRGNTVKINLTFAQNLAKEKEYKKHMEKIMIHEITHYLLLPKDTSGHPQMFWDEFNKNCQVWQENKRRNKCQ